MFRIGLTTYLMLVTLAGPSWCCCSATRLFALLAHPPQGERPQPAHSRHSCCHSQSHPTEGHSQGLPGNGHQKSEGPACPCCPCSQHCSDPVISLPADPESAGYGLTFRLNTCQDLVETVAALPTVDGATQASRECPPSPFLSARDILRALHILRC